MKNTGIWLKNTVFSQNTTLEIFNFSKTIWIFFERWRLSGVITWMLTKPTARGNEGDQKNTAHNITSVGLKNSLSLQQYM